MAGKSGSLAQEELKKYGDSASNMSALEVAAMGKYLEQLSNDDVSPAKLEMDPDDEDWNPMIEEAKGGGPRSWFASKVDFTLNSAHFLGKLGYSVHAGVVPLFDGAAIDLKFADLKAEKPANAKADPIQGEPTSYKNWITGTGGMLVLAPANMDNVIPVRMEKVTVTEEGVTGTAEKPMTFHNAARTVTATGLVLNKDRIKLVGVQETVHGEKDHKQDRDAVITGEGIATGEREKKTAAQTTDAVSKQADDQPKPQQNAKPTVDRDDVQNIPKKKGAGGKGIQVINKEIDKQYQDFLYGTHTFGNQKEENAAQKKEDKSALQTVADEVKDVIKTATKNAGKQIVDEQQDKILAQTQKRFQKTKAGQLLNEAQRLKKSPFKSDEKSDGGENEEESNKQLTVGGKGNIAKGTFEVNAEYGEKEEKPEPAPHEKAVEQVKEKTTETLEKSMVDLAHRDPQQAGERFTDLYNEASDEAKKTVKNIKDAKPIEHLKNSVSKNVSPEDAEERAKEAFAGLRDQLNKDKSTANDAGNDKSGDITLLSIPIVIPALMFTVHLKPSFSYKLFANVSGENMTALYGSILHLEKEEDTKKAEKQGDAATATQIAASENKAAPTETAEPAKTAETAKVAEAVEPLPPKQADADASKRVEAASTDQKKNVAKLRFSAGLRASFSLELEAKVAAGVPYIIQGAQSLYAGAKLSGALDNNEKAVEAFAEIPIQKNGNNYSFGNEDIKAGMTGEFVLHGTVGTKSLAESKLFGWNKVLWEKTFGEWKLANIGLNFQMTKKGSSGGLFSGWSLNEASIAVSGPDQGLGKAFTDANPRKRRYGLYDPQESLAPSATYSAAQTDFDAAVKMLRDFADAPKNKGLIIPTGQRNSGLSETIGDMQQVLNSFTRTWALAQKALEKERRKLDEYLGSESYTKKKNSATKSAIKHKDRLEKLEAWDQEHNTAEMSESEYTGTLNEFTGSGFNRALREKVRLQEMSFEKIAEYEKGRYRDLTQKSNERIQFLTQQIDKGAKPEENESIAKAYKSMGGKAFDHKGQLVGSIGDLYSFELERQRTSQAEAREHQRHAIELENSKEIKAAKEKARKQASKGRTKAELEDRSVKDEINRKEDEAGLAEYFRLYAKDLDTVQILQYGSIESLLTYEKERMTELGEEDTSQKRDVLVEKQTKKGTKLVKESVKIKAKEQDLTPFLEAEAQKSADESRHDEYEKEMYRTASLADLLEFERSKNRGKIGDMLEQYFEQNAKGHGQKSASELLKEIFTETLENGKQKNHTKDALKLFGERLIGGETGEAVQFTTIAEMQAYTKKRRDNAKTKEERMLLTKELHYLNNAQIIVETAEPGKEREEEIEQLKDYFDTFAESARQYQADLQKGETVNLKLMRHAFNYDKNNDRLAQLEKLAESDDHMLEYEVLQDYLKKTGADKDELSAFLLTKQGGKTLSPDQIKRFHASRMADGKGDVDNHFRRYSKLKQMDEDGKTYSQMIEVYRQMGGGDAYAKKIKENIQKGILYGKKMSAMSIKDVLTFEQNRVLDAGAVNQKLIDYISENEKSMSFKDLLAGYEDLSKETTMGAARRIIDKHLIKQASAYEKSKKDVMLTPKQMLDFEISDKERIGKVHIERLKKLYARDNVTDETLDKLTPPTDEAEKEKRKNAYLEEAKRYKNGRDVKLAVQASVDRICSSDKLLYQELHAHEQSRKEYYEKEFSNLLAVKKEMEDREETLKEQIAISQSVVMHIAEIKKNPKDIFQKIDEFEKASQLRKERKQEEPELQRKKNELITDMKQKKKKVEEKVVKDQEEEGGETA